LPTDVTSPTVSVTTDGSVQTLFSTVTAGVYVLHIDLVNMQGGDTIQIKATAKVIAAGSVRNVFAPTNISGVQVAPDINRRTMAVVAPEGCTFTIQRTAGGDRAYNYRVERITGVSVLASGTLSVGAVGGEQEIASTIVNGTFVLLTDHGNMIASDQVTVRVKQATVSGGTLRVDERLALTDAQLDANGEVFRQSTAIPSIYSYTATAEKVAGATHNMNYALCSVGS
jgi:hypothetical protein